MSVSHDQDELAPWSEDRVPVRERLWRCSDPKLRDEQRAELVIALMFARRSKQEAMRAGDNAAREAARLQVDAAKEPLNWPNFRH